MSNDITITWHSNMSALIADQQRQLAEQKKQIASLQQVGQAGAAAAGQIVAGAKAGGVAMREMAQLSATVNSRLREQAGAAKEVYRLADISLKQQVAAGTITRQQAAEQRTAAREARDARLAEITQMRAAGLALETQKKQQQDLAIQAERIRQANRTPKERARDNYFAGTAKADDLRQGGHLSDAEFLAEKQRLINIYKQESGLLAERKRREQELATAKKQAAADELAWMNQLTTKARQLATERAAVGRVDRQTQEAAEKGVAAELKWREQLMAKARQLAGERATLSRNQERDQARADAGTKDRQERVNRALVQGTANTQKLTGATRELNKELGGQSSLWQQLPGQLTSVMTVAGATAAAVRVVRMEFENLKSAQQDAKSSTLTFAQAEEQAQQSLDDTMTPEQLNARIKGMSRKTQISPLALMRQANQVLGVKDDKTTAKEALDVMEAMSEFSRLNPEDMAANVSGVLAMRSAMPGASTKEILGSIQQAKISSKVALGREFSANIIPGASASRAFGDSPQDFFGLASAIGGQMQDVTGRKTGTAIVDLQKDLAILSAGVEAGSLGGEAVKGGLGGNTMDRLRAIAKDPRFKGLKDRLLGENEDPEIEELFKKAGRMTTESKSFGAIRLLYQNDEAAWKALENKQAEQVTGFKAAAVVDRQMAGFSATPEQRTARAASRVEGVADLANLENESGAHGSLSRETVTKILKANGITATEQLLQSLSFEVGSDIGRQDSATKLQDLLRSRAESMAGDHPVEQPGGGFGGEAFLRWLVTSSGLASAPTRGATDDEKRAAESMRAAADALKELVAVEQARQAQGPAQIVVPPGNNDKPDRPAAGGLGNPVPAGRF